MQNAPYRSAKKRYKVAIFPSQEEAIHFAAEEFRNLAKASLQKSSHFSVALSGGNTPKLIFDKIAMLDLADPLHWNKIHVFFSDERVVPYNHPDSNYHMAYETLLSKVSLFESNIHRMKSEGDLEQNALEYDKLLQKYAPNGLDFVMLGVGEDGHTASLFPNTKALDEEKRLTVPNWVESKNTWRLTLTYPAITQANRVCVYVFGRSKEKVIADIFSTRAREIPYPIERVGTPQKPLYWVMDELAAQDVEDTSFD